jgi:hypothetical protein
MNNTVKNKILSEQKSPLKIGVLTDYFCSDSILFLTILSMKQCIYTEVRPRVWRF